MREKWIAQICNNLNIHRFFAFYCEFSIFLPALPNISGLVVVVIVVVVFLMFFVFLVIFTTRNAAALWAELLFLKGIRQGQQVREQVFLYMERAPLSLVFFFFFFFFFLERHQPVPTLESILSSFQCLIEKEDEEEREKERKKAKDLVEW